MGIGAVIKSDTHNTKAVWYTQYKSDLIHTIQERYDTGKG